MTQHELVTQAEYARRRGVSKPAVCKAIKRCRIPLIDGKLDPLVADTLWQARTDPDQQARALGQQRKDHAQPAVGQGQGAIVPDPGFSTWRQRKEAAEARNAELDLQEREGTLGRIDEMERTGRRLASAIVQHLDVVIERFPAEFGKDDAERRAMRRSLREEFDRIRAEFAKLGMMAVQ